jgi:hypothetical protein
VGVAESTGELFVLQQAGELEQDPRRERDTHQKHDDDATGANGGATVADRPTSGQDLRRA